MTYENIKYFAVLNTDEQPEDVLNSLYPGCKIYKSECLVIIDNDECYYYAINVDGLDDYGTNLTIYGIDKQIE